MKRILLFSLTCLMAGQTVRAAEEQKIWSFSRENEDEKARYDNERRWAQGRGYLKGFFSRALLLGVTSLSAYGLHKLISEATRSSQRRPDRGDRRRCDGLDLGNAAKNLGNDCEKSIEGAAKLVFGAICSIPLVITPIDLMHTFEEEPRLQREIQELQSRPVDEAQFRKMMHEKIGPTAFLNLSKAFPESDSTTRKKTARQVEDALEYMSSIQSEIIICATPPSSPVPTPEIFESAKKRNLCILQSFEDYGTYKVPKRKNKLFVSEYLKYTPYKRLNGPKAHVPEGSHVIFSSGMSTEYSPLFCRNIRRVFQPHSEARNLFAKTCWNDTLEHADITPGELADTIGLLGYEEIGLIEKDDDEIQKELIRLSEEKAKVQGASAAYATATALAIVYATYNYISGT